MTEVREGFLSPRMVVWEYSMRREMQEIAPGLFLGPYSCASKSKLDFLLSHHISHIVCIRHSLENHFVKANFPDQLKYLTLEIADKINENILRVIPVVCEFINEALDSGGKVLIHGNAGISRCAAITIAYVMQRFDLSAHDAYHLVLQRRMCINPNKGFMAQLREFEPIFRAKHMLKDSQQPQRIFKRPLDVLLEDDKLM